MDIELVRNFKKLINKDFNELILSVIEQYNSEVERLNELIVASSALVKEKETLISDLKKELEDKQFDEDNFNNVSLIHNLNKQVETLTNENKLLNTSLEARRKNDKLKAQKVVEEHHVEPELEEVVENNEVPVEVNETVVDGSEDNNEVVEDNNEVVEDNNEVVEDNNVENAPNDAENNEDNQEDGETVEVEEIEVNDKAYYVKDNKIYNKKKNGDMGSKQVGEMDNGEPVIFKKKEKKEKKNKKDKKNNN